MSSILSTAQGGLKSFFSAMLPSFEKSRLLDDFSSAIKELVITREMYDLLSTDYKPILTTEFSKLMVEAQAIPGFKGDLFGLMADIMDGRLSESGKIQEYIEHIYANVVLRDVLDYQKINMIRYVDGISFFNTYARRLVVSATTKRIGDTSLTSSVDEEDHNFVSDIRNIRSFVLITAAMSYKAADLRKAMDKMAKVTFDPATHDMAVKTNKDLDGLRLGMIPGIGSIVYHIGLAINLYHARRQELAKEERDKLQIQVMLLRRKSDNESDPDEVAKLEKQIRYYNNRINKLSARLEDMAEG